MRNINSTPTKPARFSKSVSTLSLNQKIILLVKVLWFYYWIEAIQRFVTDNSIELYSKGILIIRETLQHACD